MELTRRTDQVSAPSDGSGASSTVFDEADPQLLIKEWIGQITVRVLA